MDKILQNWNNFLNEQTEPYQRKMKAKHSRLKKRVIGHGGQKAGPPYTNKPSMERSKSAPPMGESLDEAFMDFFRKKKPEEQPKEKQPVTIPPYTDYNQIGNTNIYVGRFPMQKGSDDNRVFQPDVLEKFDKIFLVADEEVDSLRIKQPDILADTQDNKIVATEKRIDDTAKPNKEQLDYMEELALKVSKAEGNVLIACSAGKNRSSSIAARAIALKQGGVKSDQDLDNIVNMIRSASG